MSLLTERARILSRLTELVDEFIAAEQESPTPLSPMTLRAKMTVRFENPTNEWHDETWVAFDQQKTAADYCTCICHEMPGTSHVIACCNRMPGG